MRIITALILLFICSVRELHAAPTNQYENLHARYLTTRNRDPQIEQPQLWRDLARQYRAFREKRPNDTNAALAALDEAVLWQGVFSTSQDATELEACKSALEFILRKYPEGDYADDALLRLADLSAQFEDDSVKARNLYQQVLDEYPKSDMALVAAQRLEAFQQSKPLQSAEVDSGSADQVRASASSAAGISGKSVIVLDPGHGGEDFGSRGKQGLLEKDVVLAVALTLERLLIERLGVQVHLTRRRDIFIPLEQRTSFANSVKADIFLSLHVNASESSKLNGLEVYYLDNTGDQGSLKLAERENIHSPVAGVGSDLQFILSDLIQTAKVDDSLILGQELYGSMLSSLKSNYSDIRGIGVKKAPFYVLVGAHMPCILVEMFFIDHPVDGRRLASSKFREDLSEALFLGIRKYLEHQSFKRAE